MELPVTEMRSLWIKQVGMLSVVVVLSVNEEFSFGPIEVQMSSKHSNSGVEIQVDRYQRQLDTQVWTSGVDLG